MSIVLKQVYQNRLIEGRDFERWDGLLANNKASFYLTKIKGEVTAIFRFIGTSKEISQNKTAVYLQNRGEWENLYSSQLGRLDYAQSGGYKYYSTDITQKMVFSVNRADKYVYVNGENTNFIWNTTSNIQLFGDWTTNNKCMCYGFKCNNLSLTPCKLLQPCPANLSANGKAYPIGECGMIDSVSGKFYGNSGSGSFSVYNDPTE